METMKKGSTNKVEIEFLYLDLNTCTRCKNTEANLETALRAVKEVLQASGSEVDVRKVLVDSEATARKLRFVSSPTIRINGQDIALELRETPCESCTETCGCNGSVACRVWLYEGKEYNEAPVPLIVNALLSQVYGRTGSRRVVPAAATFVLPENLAQFFAAKTARKTAKSCCSPEEKASCCGPSEKEACCGSEEEAATSCSCK